MERKYLIDHLNYIQQTITRMSKNSFSIKGWLIALISSGFIFVSKDYSGFLVLSSIILICGFALLDAVYLQTERKYRVLYSLIINNSF